MQLKELRNKINKLRLPCNSNYYQWNILNRILLYCLCNKWNSRHKVIEDKGQTKERANFTIEVGLNETDWPKTWYL